MKVAIYLKDTLLPTEGGGFGYVDLLIKALFQSKISSDLILLWHKTSLETSAEKIAEAYGTSAQQVVILDFNDIQKQSQGLKSLVEKVGAQIPSIDKKLFDKQQQFITSNKGEFLREFLVYNQIGFLFYPKQHECLDANIPFVSTNWDAAHVTASSFPQVINSYGWRKDFYDNTLPKALMVFAESEAGKEELVKYCGIYEDKIKVVPMFPSNIINLKTNLEEQSSILKTYNLSSKKYFFYPAQFWALKNHSNLLYAFKQLNLSDIKLVFTGSDKGNQTYIKELAKKLNIEKQVLFLGFVSEEALYTLYKNAIALTMPTYLGPTNMPLLEAMAIGCPIICSDFVGHREMCGENALYCNPEEFLSIAKCMDKVYSDTLFASQIVNSAKLRFESGSNNINSALQIVTKQLSNAISIRKAWAF